MFESVRLNTPNLSIRFHNICDRECIITLADLASCTREYFAVLPNVGVKIIKEAEDLLAFHGMAFAPTIKGVTMSPKKTAKILDARMVEILRYLLLSLQDYDPTDFRFNLCLQILDKSADAPQDAPEPQEEPKPSHWEVVIHASPKHTNTAANFLKRTVPMDYHEAQKVLWNLPGVVMTYPIEDQAMSCRNRLAAWGMEVTYNRSK